MTLPSGQTLNRIQSLAQLYQRGYQSNVVDNTIAKLISMERSRLKRELSDLNVMLKPFEKQYGMSSADFLRRFQAGEMGDEADLFEWSAYYQMWLSVQERLQTLPVELQ
jgi:hypothetical protein